jgi:hypothetical protein
MITPILQRAPGANPGDPIREPEITWRDLVGVCGRALRRTWRARAESELRKRLATVLLNTRSGNCCGLSLVQAVAVFTQRFVKFPSISD